MFIRRVSKLVVATFLAATVSIAGAKAEKLRILTWGGYAPDEVISLFEKEYPDIEVEVTCPTTRK